MTPSLRERPDIPACCGGGRSARQLEPSSFQSARQASSKPSPSSTPGRSACRHLTRLATAGILGCALTLLLLAACHKDAPAPEKTEAAPPQIEVRDKPGLLLTYLDDKGVLKTADKVTDVPKDKRRGVRVIDLTVPPEARGAGKFIVVADLTAPKPDGTYAFQLLSAVDFDRVVATAPIQHKVDASMARAKSQITMYSTSWCPVCAKARAYFGDRKIAFEDRDVEKDEAAAVELAEKAQHAGVKPQGVPVIDVYGELVLGFDEPRIAALLSQHAAGRL